MKDNRAVRMLREAEEGGYGVIGVVSVRPSPSLSSIYKRLTLSLPVQPRNHNRRRARRRKKALPRANPPLPVGPPLLAPPHPPRARRRSYRQRAHRPTHGPRAIGI
jgi:hypothetical protein